MLEEVQAEEGGGLSGMVGWLVDLLNQLTCTGRPKDAASIVAESKTQLCKEFREAMEKDFWMASRKFWQTSQHLRKGNQGLA